MTIDEEYIFVSNHISYLDIPMMMKVVKQQKMRILGKAEMTKSRFLDLFIKEEQFLLIVRVRKPVPKLQELISYVHKKISVFICPEGTFNTTHRPLKKFLRWRFSNCNRNAKTYSSYFIFRYL